MDCKTILEKIKHLETKISNINVLLENSETKNEFNLNYNHYVDTQSQIKWLKDDSKNCK